MKACFFGGARYSQPLDSTSAKKFRMLEPLGELFVIGFSHDIWPRRFTEQAHFYLLPKLPSAALRYGESFVLGLLLACWLIVRHGVQVLVAQSPYEGCAAAWAKTIAAWLGHRVILVVESHGDFEASLFLQRRIWLPQLYRRLMRGTARCALRHADVLRAVSHSTQQQLERWAPGKPIFQFAAWTDIELFLHMPAAQGRQWSPHILYAGVLTPLKGIHHLVSAFAHVTRDFPQARLVIVGREENPRYAAALKAQVTQLSLDTRVHFAGAVSQRELAAWMGKACVFVLPSLSEGLPRVVLEAMATCTPVIGSQVGGIPELIEDGVVGFRTPPGNEAVLAEKLRWILAHPQEAQGMGHRARAFVERYFSSAAYVQAYRHIFATAQLLTQDNALS